MDLKYSLQNKQLTGMDHDFSDEAWVAFHQGEINNQDDFYDYFYQYVDNAVIYTDVNEKILHGNMEYCFEEHDVYGRPNNVAQAAFVCLYDYLMDSNDTVTWSEMEKVLNDE